MALKPALLKGSYPGGSVNPRIITKHRTPPAKPIDLFHMPIDPSLPTDSRNFASGQELPSVFYVDQPYTIVMPDRYVGLCLDDWPGSRR